MLKLKWFIYLKNSFEYIWIYLCMLHMYKYNYNIRRLRASKNNRAWSRMQLQLCIDYVSCWKLTSNCFSRPLHLRHYVTFVPVFALTKICMLRERDLLKLIVNVKIQYSWNCHPEKRLLWLYNDKLTPNLHFNGFNKC